MRQWTCYNNEKVGDEGPERTPVLPVKTANRKVGAAKSDAEPATDDSEFGRLVAALSELDESTRRRILRAAGLG